MKKLKDFSDYYSIDKTKIGIESDQQGIFETYGRDLYTITELNKINPKKIWTIVDSCESDDVLVITGLHFVNRIAYLISIEEWTDINEIYIDR